LQLSLAIIQAWRIFLLYCPARKLIAGNFLFPVYKINQICYSIDITTAQIFNIGTDGILLYNINYNNNWQSAIHNTAWRGGDFLQGMVKINYRGRKSRMEDIKNYEGMSVQEKWNVLATVANLYYNSELTQNQIAERFYTSRSKISRMLKEAREMGIVEIYIREPWERNLGYEQRLKEEFALKNIRVIIQKNSEEESAGTLIPEAAAYYLDAIIKQDMVIGISWGNTLYKIVKYIAANNHKNIPVTVVPIMGAANITSPRKDALDLSKDLALAYGGRYQYIYAPLFVKSCEVKESLVQDDSIKAALTLASNADIILTSAGSVVNKSWSNYLSPKTLEALGKKGAAGHIGGHFFDIQGNKLETSLSGRMIGISVEDLRKCPETVCVAYGEKKAEAVIGALRGRYINTLVTDDKCAAKILAYVDKPGAE